MTAESDGECAGCDVPDLPTVARWTCPVCRDEWEPFGTGWFNTRTAERR